MSDSTYVVNCFRQKWWVGWKRRGWRNSQGKPVANRDLWEQLLDLALDPKRRVTFQWVKGHSGDPMNDWVDQLATGAGRPRVTEVVGWRWRAPSDLCNLISWPRGGSKG